MDTEPLDRIAVLQATDKSSLDHDYVRHYERAFEKFRDQPIELLEVGVSEGGSLRMWERFFTQATIVGVDISPGCTKSAGGRKLVEIGSQEDPEFLCRLIMKYSPTIIIDDGSHKADDIKFTLERLFPALRPGGCYVIEDLHFHRNPENSGRPGGALDLVLNLAFMTTKPQIEPANRREMTGYFLRTIDRIEFIRHAALIWKRVPDENAAQTVATMKELVEQSGSAANWFHFVYYCLERGGGLQQAVMAARKAISLNERWALPHWRLSDLLVQHGDVAGALAAAERALALDPALSSVLRPKIEDLRRRLAM